MRLANTFFRFRISDFIRLPRRSLTEAGHSLAAPKSDEGGSFACRAEVRRRRVIRHFPRVALCVALVLVMGCRRDMFNQPSGKPLERSDFFQDNHMASRPLVPNTVARGHLH